MIFSLSANVYFPISNCKKSKITWDALQFLHEGTRDVNQSKINSFIEEYELFHVELVASIYMRFSHIINKLEKLGKTISDQNYANKIIRSMCRLWQPKVISIKESQDLNLLDMSTLFGKLTEHEYVMKILKVYEGN